VVLTEGRHLVGGDDKMTSQIGYMAHHVGHILIRRFKRGGKVPGWIEAGVAHYYEGMTNYFQTVSVCEYRGFEEVEKWTMGYGNFKEWRKKLADKGNHDRLPTVRGLFELQLEKMNTLEMAKAWSVVTYLIKNHKEEFSVFCRRTLAPWRGEKSLSQEAAWNLVFKEITPAEIEKRWRAWILEQPLGPSREDKLKLLENQGEGG
jgi:hypothetical protein